MKKVKLYIYNKLYSEEYVREGIEKIKIPINNLDSETELASLVFEIKNVDTYKLIGVTLE